MKQYNKQNPYSLDTIAIHIKRTVKIPYRSIDKINKLQNVQLKWHSLIPFYYQKSFTRSYVHYVIFGQEEKQCKCWSTKFQYYGMQWHGTRRRLNISSLAVNKSTHWHEAHWSVCFVLVVCVIPAQNRDFITREESLKDEYVLLQVFFFASEEQNKLFLKSQNKTVTQKLYQKIPQLIFPSKYSQMT